MEFGLEAVGGSDAPGACEATVWGSGRVGPLQPAL